MNRFVWSLVVFAALVLVLAIGIKRSPEKSVIQSVLIGKPAPGFSLPVLGDDSDARFASASLRGKWYLFNVWGTWCGECRTEHAVLMSIKTSGKAAIVGMDWKDQSTDAQTWLQQLGNPYEVVVEDRDGRVAIDYGVYGAPETFLVNREGAIVYRHVGAMSDDVWAKQFLARINALPAKR